MRGLQRTLMLCAIYVNTGNGFAQKESGFSSNHGSATRFAGEPKSKRRRRCCCCCSGMRFASRLLLFSSSFYIILLHFRRLKIFIQFFFFVQRVRQRYGFPIWVMPVFEEKSALSKQWRVSLTLNSRWALMVCCKHRIITFEFGWSFAHYPSARRNKFQRCS